jgi:phospholipase D3/4
MYRISLVESIPEGLLYPPDATLHTSTYDTWMNLINTAESSIEIASFYWSLRGSDIIPYPTSDKVSKSIFFNIIYNTYKINLRPIII